MTGHPDLAGLPDPYPVEPLAVPPDTTVAVPGSKSISIRAVLAAALAAGESTLEGVLRADDTEAVLGAVRALGVGVDAAGTTVRVTGGGGRWPRADAELDLRQSATSARLLLALSALSTGRVRLDGDPQLRARPMGPGLDALRSLGATVAELGEPGHLPVVVSGGPVRGGTVRLPGDVSSQFVSGLLMAGAGMAEGLRVELTTPLVSEPYVALTRDVIAAFGVTVDGLEVRPQPYRATRYRVEPDASAASYAFAAAAITGGRIRVDGLGSASRQGDVGFVRVLADMGARVRLTPDHIEVVGDRLRGIEVDMRHISDTVPTLAVVAVFAESPTRITGVGFIRAKESDRIGAVVTELGRCGIRAEEEPDGLVVHPGTPRPAVVRTYRDHRMAMAFALLGLRVPGIAVADPGCVAKTFPGYWRMLAALGTPAGW